MTPVSEHADYFTFWTILAVGGAFHSCMVVYLLARIARAVERLVSRNAFLRS